MKTGKVVWFNSMKGIGFIEDENSNLVLVDVSSIQSKEKTKSLVKGQTVTFEFEEDPSGQSIATVVRPKADKQV
jgi:cold shock CspA family protein